MTERDEQALEEAGELLRRTAAFLSDCAETGDSTIESGEIRSLIDALRQVQEDANAPLGQDAE